MDDGFEGEGLIVHGFEAAVDVIRGDEFFEVVFPSFRRVIMEMSVDIFQGRVVCEGDGGMGEGDGVAVAFDGEGVGDAVPSLFQVPGDAFFVVVTEDEPFSGFGGR